MGQYHARRRAWQLAQPVDGFPETPAWANLSQEAGYGQPPRAPAPVQVEALPSYLTGLYGREMTRFQEANLERLRSERAQTQQARAREVADVVMRAVEPAPLPQDGSDQCVICTDVFIDGDLVAYLSCSHRFHVPCLDTWVATAVERNREATCPCCRQPVDVERTESWDEPLPEDTQPQIAIPIATPSVASAAASEDFQTPTGSFPWWPVSGAGVPLANYICHTDLQDGRISYIIDPGA